jgi:hypothetical protein
MQKCRIIQYAILNDRAGLTLKERRRAPMTATASHPRLALSLSPTGGDATRPLRLEVARLSPELIEHHTRQARALRNEAFRCIAKQAWNWLTRKDRAPRWGACADEALLRPAT